MGRRLRYLPPEDSGLVEVTCRTLQGRYLLTPSNELNEITLGALGRAHQAALQRELLGLPARGPAALREQEPHAAPERLKKSPAPLFHAASRRVRRELLEGYRHFLAAFRDAAARLRAGEHEVVFPAGSFPPAAPWVAG